MIAYIENQKSTQSTRIGDLLATRTAILFVLGLLVCGCLIAGAYVRATVKDLESDHEVFHDAQIRDGYAALSDVQRLLHVAHDAVAVGAMDSEKRDRFQAAADIIYVRIDSFSRMQTDGQGLISGRASIAELKNALQIADTAITAGFPDLEQLANDLAATSEDARQNLIIFLDDMRHQSDAVFDRHAQAVRRQQAVVMTTLILMTLLSGAALHLLRREIQGRRARQEAEKQVTFLAFHDQLTGLPNRHMFQIKLKDMLQKGQDLALIFLDLDDFKHVNDTYGHIAGDAVLKHVGDALLTFALEPGGFTARIGGDEFAIVTPCVDCDHLARQCDELIRCVNQKINFEGETIKIGMSIGIASTRLMDQEIAISVDHLSRVTDFALYEAKSKGKNRHATYNSRLEQRFLARRELIDDLPHAENRGELRVYFQPKVNLVSGQTFGFEALVRWQRGGCLTPPNDFIHVAEETGLIQKIDLFVLNEATKATADWNRKRDTAYSISVNLSGLHFKARRIVGWVQSALAQSQLPAHLLTLEITETVQLEDVELTNEILVELRAMGVRISIDDFGTGYSSLAYLRAIVADELKIDRSLVAQVENDSDAHQLLAAVLDLAGIMGFSVVVEGVETNEQVEILLKLGVEFVQGFHFGAPVPIAQAFAREIADGRIEDVAS